MMTKNKANAMLNEVLEVLKNEFPDFESKMSAKCFMEDGQISFKMKMTNLEASKDINRRETETAFFKNGLVPCVGERFESRGDTFIVEGCKNRKQRFPVLCRNTSTGKQFRFSASAVKSLLKG